MISAVRVRNGILTATMIAFALMAVGPLRAQTSDQLNTFNPPLLRLPPPNDVDPATGAPLSGGAVPEPIETPPPVSSALSSRPRVTTDIRAQSWISGYQSRINEAFANNDWRRENAPQLPPSYAPWWDARVREPLNTRAAPLQIGIATLSEGALRHSSYVHVISAEPNINRTELVLESAEFDWRSFLKSTYNDVNDPVGNSLTTGTNSSRYKDRTLALQAGVRRHNELGGDVEVFQRVGSENSNSRFLTPNPQRTTRLQLQYTQPLMQGAGRVYNGSQIVLAQIQVDQSYDLVAEQLSAHLVKVSEAYWDLYRARVEYLQRQKLLASAEVIQINLNARREVDAVQRQVYRARAAVAKRKSEMIRSGALIRNGESQLRFLVNDPLLLEAPGREYTTEDSPLLGQVVLDMSESLHTALLSRADISQAICKVRSAAVALGVAEKDVLPRLDLVASTYIAGLAAAVDTGQAIGNQFAEGRPTYSVGLEFEIPFGNRAANALAERRRLEVSRAMNHFRLTVEAALTRVEIAVREVDTSYRDMIAKVEAAEAAENEANYLEVRWKVLPGPDDSAALLLENLLDAQERLADEERAVVRAQVEYALALMRLKGEMGTLLRVGDH